jgi:hypothetical protein
VSNHVENNVASAHLSTSFLGRLSVICHFGMLLNP